MSPERVGAEPVPLATAPAALTGGTVAIGNFDGVHRGHQAVLSRALEGPRPVIALTFEPHPRAYFSGAPIFRLTPPAEKARAMAAFGLDGVVVAPFDAALAALTADAFVREILVERLRAAAIVVGHDFKFGARRAGDGALLARLGPSLGFETGVVEAFDDDGGAVSSTRIREHLAAGEVGHAGALMGRRYAVEAEVVHGAKRGRTLNYPTANQALDPANGLAHGIYAVRARIDGAWRGGVASFGRRPTFDDGAPLLETFVFDFAGDLYGRPMRVAFERFLRGEARFDGVAPLVAQMDRDADAAREALEQVEPLSPLDATLNF